MPTAATALWTDRQFGGKQGAWTTDLALPSSSVKIEVRLDSQVWDELTANKRLAALFAPGIGGLPRVAFDLDGDTPLLLFRDGFTQSAYSATPFPFDRGIYWISVDFDFDDGGGNHVVEFAYSTDDTDDPDAATWVVLDTQITPGTVVLDAVASPVSAIGKSDEDTISGDAMDGYWRAARITLDAAVAGFPEFYLEAVDTLVFTDTVGATWNVLGEASIVDHPAVVPTIYLAGASLIPRVNGPRITVPEDLEHPMRARLLELPSLSFIDNIYDSFADTARAQRSSTGTGSLALMRDDLLVDELYGPNRAVQFVLEGQAAFTMLIEGRSDTIIAQGEESEEVTQFTGRGHLAVLDRMRLYPSRGVGQQPVQRQRVFNFAEPVYDDSSWPLATNVGAATGPIRQPGLPQVGIPEGGPSIPGNFWLGAAGDTSTFAPPGHRYFRGIVSIPSTRPYVVFWAADNWGELFIDGQRASALNQAGSYRNFNRVTPIEVTLSAGNILLAAHVANNVGPSPNPTGLYLVIASTTADGEIDDIIATSADIAWKSVGPLEDPPGMTPGEVANIALNEYEARCSAALQEPAAYITRTWTDDNDSLGQAWSTSPNIATEVGTSLLAFFTEMSATYFDMRMQPGSFTLDLIRKGTTVDSGVIYAPAPPGNNRLGNVRGLNRKQAG